ncbi:MAG: GNAT family N-acetyltransferase [Aristaeellaceae bacterium]
MPAITIRPLTSERIGDYLDFFDHRAFTDQNPNGPCCCTSPTQTPEEVMRMIGDFAAYGVRATLRRYAEAMLAAGRIHGYLACDGAKAIGWCNADDMQAYTAFVPDFARACACGKAMSIVCFEIAPEYRGMGVASALIGHVCDAARTAGYAAAEGYAEPGDTRNAFDFHGPVRLFERNGFVRAAEQDGLVIMRRLL